MDTQTLRTFLTVLDLGNFTKAAKELNYAQSTVSDQIKQLERELGFPLFDRIGKQVLPTSMGLLLRPYAENIMSTLQQINTLSKSPHEMHGILRVGSLESLMFSSMVDVLVQYKKQYPNIDVQVKAGFIDNLIEQLKQNLLDFVYISDDLKIDPHLVCCYKRCEKLSFIAAPNHELARQQKISLQTLFSHPIIRTEKSGICYRKLDALATSIDTIPQYSLSIENLQAIVSYLLRVDGIAFLPRYAVDVELRNGSLVELDVDIEPQIYYTQILYCKNKWVSPFMSDLIEEIRVFRPTRDFI